MEPLMWQSTTDPIIDNLLPQFGLEGQLEANEIDEETEDFLFPQNNTYFLFGKNEEGAALREDVDKALKEMKEDGTLSKITTEYLAWTPARTRNTLMRHQTRISFSK